MRAVGLTKGKDAGGKGEAGERGEESVSIDSLSFDGRWTRCRAKTFQLFRFPP